MSSTLVSANISLKKAAPSDPAMHENLWWPKKQKRDKIQSKCCSTWLLCRLQDFSMNYKFWWLLCRLITLNNPVIDFLTTRHWKQQFGSLVLKQTDHTPVVPPHSVCLLDYSSIHSPCPHRFCFLFYSHLLRQLVVKRFSSSCSHLVSASFHSLSFYSHHFHFVSHTLYFSLSLCFLHHSSFFLLVLLPHH